MTALVTLRGVRKAYGERVLFSGLTLHLGEGERLGLIGPNGAGKTTLLSLLGGREVPDEGERLVPHPIRPGWVEQSPDFPPEATVEDVLVARLAEDPLPGAAPLLSQDEATFPVLAGVTLGRLGFGDPTARVSTLSGGWLRRLAIARALVNEPDLLLLDEPTNHLDLESILWLESFLLRMRTAYVVISHDRAFLQAVATRVLEVDPRYPGGTFVVAGRYHEFLERREELLVAQSSRQASLESRVAREVEWLSRGPKARTTKARGRIDEAERLKAELAEMKTRARVERTQIDFAATHRQTRRLLVAEDLGCKRGGRWLFRRLDLLLRPGTRLGLVGPNGSGKTTLLNALGGELPPQEGILRWAPKVEMVMFEQQREALDPAVSLRRALAPEGDSVLHLGRSVHVAGWARRFRFRPDQLDTPVGRLSGGEQAKVLIARLMLRPADILLLDEPTNDLDLPTLEVLEEALLEFCGAVVLITHDRYLLDRVSTLFLELGGGAGENDGGDSRGDSAHEPATNREPTTSEAFEGATRLHADLTQWLASQRSVPVSRAARRAGHKTEPRAPTFPGAGAMEPKPGESKPGGSKPGGSKPGGSKPGGSKPGGSRGRGPKALTYGEEIELAGLEDRIAQAEAALAALEESLADPAIAADAVRIAERFAQVQEARASLESLFNRWTTLESKREGE